MCTVSFIIKDEKVIITSNRDEQTSRPLALKPEKIKYDTKNILFPKDEKGGGTWLAVDELGNAIVLLNGAFKRHIPQKKYRKSRGLIVLDIITHENPASFLEEIALENIEPFTIILWTNTQKLYELIWNGTEKFIQELPKNQHYIYSSVTLYDENTRTMRKQWFENFIIQNPKITPDLIRDFHTNTATDNKENGLIINRNEQVKTYSVTQITIEKQDIMMIHHDILAQKIYNEKF